LQFNVLLRTIQPVDVEVWGAPTLAIEISSTSLSDDLGDKRYCKTLGVGEYWVVNVIKWQRSFVFEVANLGSRQIQDFKLVSNGIAHGDCGSSCSGAQTG
jgi:Uma2 family endonuclease